MPARARRRWTEGRAARVVAIAACAIAVVFVALPEVALSRVRGLLDARRHDAAGRWLDVAAATSLRRAEVHFQTARLARRREDFPEVSRRLRAAHTAGWPVAELEREQWLAQAQAGQVAEMQAHWVDLFDDPRSDGPEISRAFVIAELARIRFDDARRVLDAWEADYPDDPGPHVFRGLIHSIQLEWDDAAASYRRAIAVDRTNVEAWRGLGEALSKRLRFEQALAAWTALLEIDPTDVVAAVGRCDCLVRLGDVAIARRELDAVIARLPDDVTALDIAGRLELAAGDAARAVEWLTRAVALRPEDAELRYALGRALRLAGDRDAAREHLAFREAAADPLERLRHLLVELPRQPWDADIRAEIGDLTYHWKSHDEGLEWFRRALDVDPKHARSLAFLEAHDAAGSRRPAGGAARVAAESAAAEATP